MFTLWIYRTSKHVINRLVKMNSRDMPDRNFGRSIDYLTFSQEATREQDLAKHQYWSMF